MKQQTNTNVPLLRSSFQRHNSAVYLILALSGLSFLFFLGFPFANHNESYLWVVLLDKISFMDALTTRLEPVQSFRPLGTATAWLTYRLTGTVYLQQLFNWLLACLSFGVLFSYTKNKLFFSLVALAATAGFFSGYIYLFHLHGVFYGPLQLYIALLAGAAYTNKTPTPRQLLFLFLLTVVAALYHTFALLVFAAYIGGCILQVPKNLWRARLPQLFGFLIASLLFIYYIIRLHPGMSDDSDAVQGTLASFTTTEINLPLRLLSLLLAIATTFTLPLALQFRRAIAIIIVLLSVVFIYLHLPVLLLWIGLCVLKMALSRNWALAAIVFATAIFPVATHTGTPTYLVFVIMTCIFVTAIDAPYLLNSDGVFKKLTPVFLSVLVLVLVLLKAGIHVPGVSSGLKPVLAEQEKTKQLEAILQWKKGDSAFAYSSLRFFDESSKPSASKNAVNRNFRPPTQQGYLNRYCAATMRRAVSDTSRTTLLLITFGGKTIQGHQRVLEVPGTWNGSAYVYQ